MLNLVLVLEFLQVAAQKSESVLGLCHLSVVVRIKLGLKLGQPSLPLQPLGFLHQRDREVTLRCLVAKQTMA
jgi:hypothetical protein